VAFHSVSPLYLPDLVCGDSRRAAIRPTHRLPAEGVASNGNLRAITVARECIVNAGAEHSAERVRYYLSISAQPYTAAAIPPPRFPVKLPHGYLPGVV
jgi:hypothetical protein